CLWLLDFTQVSTQMKHTQLKSLGAELVTGDMDDGAELDAAFKGVYGVFSVQNFWLPNVGFEGEIRQGKLVADVAKAAGVQHLVYSSVGSAHRGMGQKHFESKWIIEQYIHTLDVPFTIFRPVAFMDNNNWTRAYILSGTYTGQGLNADKGFQTIAVEDIAVFVSLAFADSKSYNSNTIELAGDELTETQTAEVFSKVIGRPVTLTAPTPGQSWAPAEEAAAAFNFFNGEGYDADIAALRKLHPDLLRFEEYLRRNGWENQQPIPIPEKNGWG
ncbi:MAG: NmrA/HSCARG family protein, partial [Chloroflexota bacterium]